MQKNVLKKSFISHKKDLLLGAALLGAALCLFLLFHFVTGSSGHYISVKSDGKVIATYSLDQNATYVIDTVFGSNTLVIEDGCAYVIDASCQDKICEGMGKISRKGEMIICLPNELFITVTAGEDGEVDAVVR